MPLKYQLTLRLILIFSRLDEVIIISNSMIASQVLYRYIDLTMLNLSFSHVKNTVRPANGGNAPTYAVSI